jgi:hypothetical protein
MKEKTLTLRVFPTLFKGKQTFTQKLSRMIFICSCFFILNANAQTITNYAFSSSSGTYTPIVGGTTLSTVGGTFDTDFYPLMPLGFTFYYMGIPYTTASASCNGFITLGQLTTANDANNLSTGTPRPLIAPLWDDCDMPVGTFSYLTTGTAGSRVFTAQWSTVEWFWNNASPSISFQLKLYEATGAIEFVYDNLPFASTGASGSIGISGVGTGSGNFLSLNGTGATPTASSTTETTTLATEPATGQTYTFTPSAVIPAAPTTLTFTAVNGSSMTLNWVDNSTNEVGFNVFRSTDSITFTYVGSMVATTTSAGTGTGYSSVQTGLTSGTTYYYRVVAVNEGLPSANLIGTQATTTSSICGVRSVGPTGNYTSLTAAFAAIAASGVSCPVILELEASYVSSVETFPITIPPLGNNSTNTITIRPDTGATNLLIAKSAAQIFNLNGANYLIIDGRAGGLGTTSQLTISDSLTTGSTIRFINGASNNTIKYCTIKGLANATTNGVIVFSTAGTLEGNNNNTIDNCDIGAGTANPFNLIYALGTYALPNTNNNITNNNLHDFFSAGSVSMCLRVIPAGI